MTGRLRTWQSTHALCLMTLLAACVGREPETPNATAGAAVIRNSIHIGLIETTFFVVDAVDGTKVHEKLDFKRQIEISPGGHSLRVTHYTDALWGSRESEETCTINLEAQSEAVYELQGGAERDEWSARLVDPRTSREWPCRFPDETVAAAAGTGEGAAAPVVVAPAAGGTAAAAESSARVEADHGDVGVEPAAAAAQPENPPTRRRSFCPRGFYRVAHLDGYTTLSLERSDRIRLIGVKDEPSGLESGPDPIGVEGKCVRFDYEPTNLIDGHRDRDGRLLAYVYLEDGTFVNLELIRQGDARASDERHQHLAAFLAAQSEARNAGAGIWGNP